jgi:hypothetical protein
MKVRTVTEDNCNQMLSDLLELSPNPVLKISKDGNVLYSNNAARNCLNHLDFAAAGSVLDTWTELVSEVCTSGESKEIQ